MFTSTYCLNKQCVLSSTYSTVLMMLPYTWEQSMGMEWGGVGGGGLWLSGVEWCGIEWNWVE